MFFMWNSGKNTVELAVQIALTLDISLYSTSAGGTAKPKPLSCSAQCQPIVDTWKISTSFR